MNDKMMRIELASARHESIFNEWSKFDHIETKTCRPIMDGKKLPSNNKLVVLIFFFDKLEEPIGRFRYFDINLRNRSAEFGYTVNPKYRGQGLGTSMLAFIINFLFKTTDFNKLYCQTAVFNLASIKLLEKLKFNKDAILREHHELDGKLWDDYIYSILRSEWEISKIFNH
ncbi:GNAT family N-acetyltransferase [Nostoc sp.]